MAQESRAKRCDYDHFADQQERTNFADLVARTCYQHYSKLPKSGKPRTGVEWTTLAAIVMSTAADIRVLSMATGSKCIGQSKMCPSGFILNDSHAEVLARRAFLRYIMFHLQNLDHGCPSSSSIFERVNGRFMLKTGVELHFFSSQVPCGDAAIFPTLSSIVEEDVSDESSPQAKRKKLDVTGREEVGDIHRTGAKCVAGGVQDPLLAGERYHNVGILRTKPGRGDRTLSMSCSDKLARWNVLGLQGALLMSLLDAPLYLASIVVGKCTYSEAALRRAVIDRSDCIDDLPDGYRVNKPRLLWSHFQFEHSQGAEKSKLVPAAASIIWCNVPEAPLEVAVDGFRQGTTKKNRGTSQSRCSVCKYELFATFRKLLTNHIAELTQSEAQLETYEQHKQLDLKYGQAKSRFLKTFATWTSKPKSLLRFTLQGKLK